MKPKHNWRGLVTKRRNVQGHAGGWYVTRASDHRQDLITLIRATLVLAAGSRPLRGPWLSRHAASRILKTVRMVIGLERSKAVPMKQLKDAAFAVSVHEDASPCALRINLTWLGNHDIYDFNFGQLGKVVNCGSRERKYGLGDN
jgi:hypothetical protein